MGKRVITTKSIGLVHQLVQNGQIKLAPEFQRNAVWPRAAKAYLIDTILAERPMPLFFFQRGRSAQTGKPLFIVVDGQQRLRAIFEYLEDRFALTETEAQKFKGKKYSQLSPQAKELILDYDLNVEELSGYSEEDVKDIFVRMNKYVVKLSPQELRHARESGAFYQFAESTGRLPIWKEVRIFTPLQLNRMKAVEFSAELAILLIEGPQDKKSSIDLYYIEYQAKFAPGAEINQRLRSYFEWIQKALPSFRLSRFRKPVDLYALIGALDEVTNSGGLLKRFDPAKAGKLLTEFQKDLDSKRPSKLAGRYLLSASQQTDNIGPRQIRIQILHDLLKKARA